MYRILLIYAMVLMTPTLRAQSPDHLVTVKDLKSKWLTVDRDGTHYVPYIRGGSLTYPVIGMILNAGDGAGLILSICIPEGTAIFMNNKIVDRTDAGGCRNYNIDSLRSIHSQQSLFISFFKENLNPDLITTALMVAQPMGSFQAQSNSIPQIKKRPDDHFSDFFVIAILLVAAFYAFLRNRYPKGYRDFFNFSKAFSMTLKEEKVLTQRNMTAANALFLLMYSMVISLIIILFWKIFQGIPDLFKFVALNTVSSCFVSWIVLSLMAYTVVGMKYILIKVLCSLLNIDKIALIHFFDFMRISLIFVSATLIISSVMFLSVLGQIVSFNIILYWFMILLGVRIVILLFKLIGGTSYRKIHLIPYLCTTEILPLLIGIRIFF
jgi:hypothetical protein